MANENMVEDYSTEEDDYNKALQEASNSRKLNTMAKGVVSLEISFDLK